MRRLKRTACFIVVAIIMLCSVSFSANAALFAFETQFDYSEANPAWLTDLVAKESMSELEQLAARLTIQAVADYPYTETPESFREKVAYYCTVYNIDEDSLRAAYVYMFQIMGDYSYIIESKTTDEQIKEYLIGRGIIYPDNADEDTLILARAFYVALVTGALDPYIDDSSLSGMQLEKAIIDYASVLCGVDTTSLSEWIEGGNILSLDDYVLATARLSLWTSGYDVTPQTPATEVYRQLAIKVIEEQGISASGDLTTEELKIRYMAAMLSQSYGVQVNSDKLQEAVAGDTVAYYMLQLLGQQAGLSLKPEEYSYEDAFYIVADNSTVFSIESDEFYADIFEYDVQLKYIRNSIWLYPTSYSGDKDAQYVSITVDGTAIKDNYYNEIQLNPALNKQTLSIRVVYSTNSNTEECTYLLNVYQGDTAVPVEETTAPSSEPADGIDSASSIVNSILASFGVSSDLSDSFSSISSFPSTITGVLSVLTPSFAETTTPSLVDVGSDVFTSLFEIIDTVGERVDFDLSGIGGFSLLSLFNKEQDEPEVEFLEVSFVEEAVLPPSEIETPVVPDVSVVYPAEETTQEASIAPATVEGTIVVAEENSSYKVNEIDGDDASSSSTPARTALICLSIVVIVAVAAFVVIFISKKRNK